MKDSRLSATLLLALLFAFVAIPAMVSAQTCNLQTPSCPGAPPCGFTCTPALGGCGAATPVAHSSVTECTGGSFDLIGTAYELTCGTGTGCTQLPPLLRFWQEDNYDGANHGCGYPGPAGGEWIINTGLDFGFGTPGHWHLFQSNWQGCSVGGCPAGARTVAEVSDVVLASEGLVSHDAWYMVGSVDLASGSYDFDRLMGGTVTGGCGEASPPESSVNGVTIVGRRDFCTGTTIATFGSTHPTDNSYVQVDVMLETPTPDSYSEAGHNTAPLIAGYQVVFAEGPEPTSSDPATGGWQPVHDNVNPAAMRAGIIPVGTAGAVTVTIPNPVTTSWLATRIVYADSTVNPTGAFTFPGGPALQSPASNHCGPLQAGGIITSVNFDDVTAVRAPAGTLVRWTTAYEDDVRGFSVFRQTIGTYSEAAIEVTDSIVEEHGEGKPYEFVDESTAGDDTTYFYYVMERTIGGPGQKSPIVEAISLSDGEPGGGRRDRKRQTRKRQTR